MRRRRVDTIPSLRREIVEDSLTRAKALARLLRLVREEERQKTIADLSRVRDRAER